MCPMCPNPFSASSDIAHAGTLLTVILKFSGLTGTFCHLFLSASPHTVFCFPVNICTERGMCIAWVGRVGMGIVAWSDLCGHREIVLAIQSPAASVSYSGG